TEFLLYSASRAQHVTDLLAPALERGAVVISDRFASSSVAYQGAGRELGEEFVSRINQDVVQGVSADLTVLLDLEVELGLERISSRDRIDRLERADTDFHRRVRRSFLRQAEEKGWQVI